MQLEEVGELGGSLVYTVFSRPFLAESKSHCSKVALPIIPDAHYNNNAIFHASESPD